MGPSWSESFGSALLGIPFYFLFGAFFFVAFLALVLPPVWLAALVSQVTSARATVWKTATFLFLVFLFGAAGNFVFALLLQNR